MAAKERGNDPISEKRLGEREASAAAVGSTANVPSNAGIGIRAPAILDMLSASRFWLYDVAPIDGLSLPLFQPLSGFTSITAPEVTAEAMDINEGNALYPTKVIKSATVGTITLSRGVSYLNADFYNWMTAALVGTTGNSTARLGPFTGGIGGVTYRRDLMLIHFFRNFGMGRATSDKPLRTASAAAAAAGSNALLAGKAASLGSLWGTAQQAGFALMTGTVKVPARAFLLKGCIPIRYKSGSDFDAATGDISIQELELDVHSWEEISLGAV